MPLHPFHAFSNWNWPAGFFLIPWISYNSPCWRCVYLNGKVEGHSSNRSSMPTSLWCRSAGIPTDTKKNEISALWRASQLLCSVSSRCHPCSMVSSEGNFQTVKEWEENGNVDEFLQTDHMTFSVYFLLSFLVNSDNLSLSLMLATVFPSGNCSTSVSEPSLPLFHLISFPLWTTFPEGGKGVGCGSYSSMQGCQRMNGHYWLCVFSLAPSLAPYFANLWNIMREIHLQKITEKRFISSSFLITQHL